MTIRRLIEQYGRALACHRSVRNARVFGDETMPQAVNRLPLDQRRALMSWLTNEGPFWQDNQPHDGNEWFEHRDLIVTETAVGEAAWKTTQGMPHGLVSMDPSGWLYDPIAVMHQSNEAAHEIAVPNVWTIDVITKRLSALPRVFENWTALSVHLRRTCIALRFAENAFEPISAFPFVRSVADQIERQLAVLNELQQLLNLNNSPTQRTNEIFRHHFTGEHAWFKNESESNQNLYRQQLTFPHPDEPGAEIYCAWHAHPNTPKTFAPIRIHFSGPPQVGGQTFIAYVGRKITTK